MVGLEGGESLNHQLREVRVVPGVRALPPAEQRKRAKWD